MRNFALATTLFVLASPAAAQSISVRGPTGMTISITSADLRGLPRQAFVFDAHGQKHTYEGPLLIDVLAKAGAPTGKVLRGAALGLAVIVRAADGYTVVYGLAELDPGTRSNRTILADTADGKPLGGDDGPFKVTVEGDLRPARGVRMVQSIEVVDLRGSAGTPHSH